MHNPNASSKVKNLGAGIKKINRELITKLKNGELSSIEVNGLALSADNFNEWNKAYNIVEKVERQGHPEPENYKGILKTYDKGLQVFYPF